MNALTRCGLGIVAFLAAHLCHGGESSGQERAVSAGQTLIGTPAPRMSVTTIDGNKIDLGALYGKQAVYLKFWATWCVPCRQQMPHFESTYQNAGADLAVIAVNTGFNDTVQTVRAYQRKLKITMPIVIDDGRLAAAFNLRVTPQHIVIGRNGRILYVGHLADENLEAALAQARAGGARQEVQSRTPPSIRTYALNERLPPAAPLLIDGSTFPLRDPAQRSPTVMVFLSPWCESYLETTRPEVAANCRTMREHVEALQHVADVRWVGVASGLWASPADLKDYQIKHAVGIPLSLDESGALFRSFGISEVPAAVVIDSSGRLSRRLTIIDLQSPVALHQAIGTPPT